MHIERLEVKNFRCLEDITINFPANNNRAVIVGINGSGKSALLDAIAKLLNSIVVKMQGLSETVQKSSIAGFNSGIEMDDVHLYQSFCSINVSFDVFKISLSRNVEQEKKAKLGNRSLDNFILYFKEKAQVNPLTNYPCFAYYTTYQNTKAFARLKKLTPPKILKNLQLLSYSSCLNINPDDFSDFKNWYESEENFENQKRVREDDSYRNPNIVLIKKSIELFLKDLLVSDFSNLRIQREETKSNISFIRTNQSSIVSEMFIDKQEKPFKLGQLSSGEKRLLMLVTDLARRLAIANPGLGENALEGEGIILIDEIDLHLHPQWQRRVLPALTQTFPNCQFIVTTHSPQVLSEVPRESVFILEDGKLLESSPHTRGRDSNSILGTSRIK
jgi:predicted ATP-binding protein involved in virulence